MMLENIYRHYSVHTVRRYSRFAIHCSTGNETDHGYRPTALPWHILDNVTMICRRPSTQPVTNDDDGSRNEDANISAFINHFD